MSGGMNDAAIFRPIGYVENAFAEPAAPDVLASAESRIILDPALAEGLEGVEEGQPLMGVFLFHAVHPFDFFGWHIKERREEYGRHGLHRIFRSVGHALLLYDGGGR